jgi:pilus assembly protein CpaF
VRPGDVEARIRALVEREAALLDAGAREALVARVAERSFGLGPLEPLLRDPGVDEVMVNGTGPVWVERAGRLECTEVRFASAGELRDAIERILAPLGRRVDAAAVRRATARRDPSIMPLPPPLPLCM